MHVLRGVDEDEEGDERDHVAYYYAQRVYEDADLEGMPAWEGDPGRELDVPGVVAREQPGDH